MREKVFNMENVLREILRKSPYFEEINENRFVPEYLGLIVNGVVVYHVNWIDIVEKEIILCGIDIRLCATSNEDDLVLSSISKNNE